MTLQYQMPTTEKPGSLAVDHHARELATLMAQEEEERQWIALEVHDRIAQTLATAFQQLQVLESMTRPDPKAWQVATRASTLLREAMREARNIMNDLYPPVLEEFGVVPLIEEDLHHLQEETASQAKLEADFTTRPSHEVEVALYRIFHEGLINVRRHAHATLVLVTLKNEHQGVQLEVTDNGVGFDVSATLGKKRVGGIMSMQRRAELVGGSCRIDSKPGHGTRLEVFIPLAAATTGGAA